MLDHRPQCVDNGVAGRRSAVDNGIAEASTLGRLRAFWGFFEVIFRDRVGVAIPPHSGGTATGGMPGVALPSAGGLPPLFRASLETLLQHRTSTAETVVSAVVKNQIGQTAVRLQLLPTKQQRKGNHPQAGTCLALVR